MILVNLLAAYIPQLIKSGIDKIELLSDFIQANDLNQVHDVQGSVLKIVIFISVLALFMAFFRIGSRQVIFGIGRQIEFDLKKNIFNHLVTLQPSFFETRRTGDLMSIITNDVMSIRALGGFAMLNIVNTLVAFILILPLMFSLNVNLTWAFLGLIPIVIFFVVSLSGKIKNYQQKVQEKLGEISNFIEQNLSGIHIIKAYGQEESEIKRFLKYNENLREENLKLAQIRSFIGPVMRVIASLGFILLLYFGGKGVIEGSFTTGDFAAYALYVQRLIWPVATLGWLITVVYRAQVSQERIQSILDVIPKIKDSETSINKKTFDSVISLKSLDSEIKKGQNIGIVGTIGSGKSVLAHKLMHLKELEANEILLDGIDIKSIKLDDLRTIINLVPQENFLFSTTIFENIAYAKDLNQEQVEELAKLVLIHDEINSFPDGYQTIVGERGVTLSGGQRQRIAIARALALNSEILILDDALSSLDETSSQEILKNILKMRKGMTTIFITHKMSLCKNLDEIFVMDKFNIVEKGSHEELMSGAGLYKELIQINLENHKEVMHD